MGDRDTPLVGDEIHQRAELVYFRKSTFHSREAGENGGGDRTACATSVDRA
jgi:hypothetical protein